MRTFTISILLLAILFSCGGKIRKPRKPKPRKPLNKKTISQMPKRTNIGNLAVGAILATGAYIVTEELLTEAFLNAEKKEPIQVALKNKSDNTIPINYTKDGTNWYNKDISPSSEIDIESAEKGLIGLECLGKHIKIDKSNVYMIRNEGGKVNFYGH